MASIIDLTESTELTLALLDDTWAWRQRLVEEVELRGARHARIRSSYQVEIPPQLLDRFVGDEHGDAVRVLLPITTRPKGPLLNFDLTGPNAAPAKLLLRSDIAVIQGEYLARLAESSVVGVEIARGLPRPLLESICTFTPATARWFGAEARPALAQAWQWAGGAFGKEIPMSDSVYRTGLANYLTAGLGFTVTAEDVASWDELVREAAQHLQHALAEGAHAWSSSEDIRLALPRLAELPVDVDEAGDLIAAYAGAVGIATEAEDLPLLSALGEYGRRWEVIAECVLPIGEPGIVRITEDRPQELSPWRSRASYAAALGDARSYHLQIRTADDGVRLRRLTLAGTAGQQIGIPNIEGVRESSELQAVYSSDPDRPYYVTATVRLQSSPDVVWPGRVLEVLLLAATVAAYEVDGARSDLIAALALLAVPSTFAATWLLVREQSGLGARLQRWTKRRVATWFILLWVIVVTRVF